MSISHGMVCEGATYGIAFVYLKKSGMIIQYLYINHRPVCYLKYNVSVSGFCLRLQVKACSIEPNR
jgi:hypothetical protein